MHSNMQFVFLTLSCPFLTLFLTFFDKSMANPAFKDLSRTVERSAWNMRFLGFLSACETRSLRPIPPKKASFNPGTLKALTQAQQPFRSNTKPWQWKHGSSISGSRQFRYSYEEVSKVAINIQRRLLMPNSKRETHACVSPVRHHLSQHDGSPKGETLGHISRMFLGDGIGHQPGET